MKICRELDNSDEKVVWHLQSSWREKPDEWLEGRVEVGHEWEEEHEYRVSILYNLLFCLYLESYTYNLTYTSLHLSTQNLKSNNKKK